LVFFPEASRPNVCGVASLNLAVMRSRASSQEASSSTPFLLTNGVFSLSSA